MQRAGRLLWTCARCSPTTRHAGALRGLIASSGPTLTPSHRTLHCSPSSSGILDTFRDAYGSAFAGEQDKRERRAFEVQMRFLSDNEKRINGDVFLALLEQLKVASGMGGMKEHLPWVQNNPALTEFKDQTRIVSAMTPTERRDIGTVRISAKKRIARDTGLAVNAVEAVVTQIESLADVQKWMLKRIKSQQPLPRDAGELRNMLSAPSSGMRARPPRGTRMPNPGVTRKGPRR